MVMEKKTVKVCLLLVILVLMNSCATYDSFELPYIKSFRKEMKQNYDCFESLSLEIDNGNRLIVECHTSDLINGVSRRKEAWEIYDQLVILLSSEKLIDDYLNAIEVGYTFSVPTVPIESINPGPEIILDFYVGSQRHTTTVPFTVPEHSEEDGYPHTVYVYYGFPGWPGGEN